MAVSTSLYLLIVLCFAVAIFGLTVTGMPLFLGLLGVGVVLFIVRILRGDD